MSHGDITPPQLSGSPAPLSPASSAGNHNNLPGADPSSGPMRRKPSRRANTAERRATHNAVERQRRETLNGRFLDLAALLPNLAAVRRPSKSAIVNSSIALVHTQRRQRAIAARELRGLKSEVDRLRAEVNEWRGQASVPREHEPPRSAEFHSLLILEDTSLAEEEEIKRAYEMAAIRTNDDDDDGYGDMAYDAPAPPPPPPSHHHAVQQQQQQQQHMHQGPPMHHQPPPMHHGYGMVPQSAPAHIAHHPMPPNQQQQSSGQEIQALHAAAAMMQNSRPPPVHIPAFDGPSMFPGPGHHNGHGNMFQQQYSNNNSPGVGGSPPHTGHGNANFPYSSRPPSSSTSFARDGGAPFAHAPPPRQHDDDSVSSSSGGGSPPATGLSQFSHNNNGHGAGFGHHQSHHTHHQEVPTLAAGATPADFARFWAGTNPATGKQAGFAPPPASLGFAM